MFSFFILFYFPAQQEKYLLRNYNKEVANLAGTVALGVKIALIEQNFEGVQTSMEFVKDDPHLRYVAMVQLDTVWNEHHNMFTLTRKLFKSYPDSVRVDINAVTSDSLIIKSAPFETNILSGEILLGFTTSEINQSKKQIRTTSMMVSAVVFIIGILIGFWLARRISIPVLALRDAAERVGEGDRTQFLKTSARDEIGDLTRAFNKMVVDLKHAEDKIKSAQAQLVASEKMASLGQLTAGIAHEIKNPLNFVNNFSELSSELLDQFQHSKNEQERLEILHDLKGNLEKITLYGKRADSIITGMLMHSRNTREDKVPVDVNKLCEEAMNLAFHSMRAKEAGFNGSLEKNLEPELPKVNAHAHDLSRVFLNLISNALYAVWSTHKSGKTPVVTVSTHSENGCVFIKVRDNGPGIPEKVISKIFEPFFTTKPSGEGTGLGLSISYEIIKAHGGVLSVQSRENDFTEFTISIPV